MPEERRYRVMVVEDETIILNHLISKIQELPLPLEVSAFAANGEDAFDLIRQSPPDILFTDVRMPVMNGLQLAEKIYEEYPDILMVIISGYEEFEYAQQAIRYHVSDYLLKPVNLEKLLATTEKLCRKLSERFYQTTKEKIHLALSGSLPQEKDNCLELFSVLLIKTGNLYTKESEALAYGRTGAFWEASLVSPWLTNYFSASQSWWLEEIKEFSYHALVVEGSCPLLRKDLFQYLNSPDAFHPLPVSLCEYPKLVSLAQMRSNLYQLYDSVASCLIPFFSQEWLFQPTTVHSVPPRMDSIFERFLLRIKSGQVEQLEKDWKSLLMQWRKDKLTQQEFLDQIRSLFIFLAGHNACTASEHEIMTAIQSLFASCLTETEFYQHLFKLILEWVIEPLSEGHSGMELYQKIKQYIEKHLEQPLTVEALAEAFHFSASYISRVFKKYGKQSPIQYLIQMRMCKAAQLMDAHPEMDIKIIAELVGYQDQHYFSRYFKQYYKTAPSEYKQKQPNN